MTKRKETPENLRAFKLYKKLMDDGNDDVFQQVGEKFDKQPKTIYNWSSLFKWKERREKLNEKARERALERLVEKAEKQDIRAMDKLIDNLQRAEENVIGSIDSEFSVNDYEKLLKLYRLFRGESTENSKSEIDYNLNEDDKKTLQNLSKDKAKEIMNVKLDIKNEEKKGGKKDG